MLRKILGSTVMLLLCFNLIGQENRSISGYGNNLLNKEWGAAHSQVLRISSVNYADGISKVNDSNLPIPREISNKLFEQNESIKDLTNLSDFIWVFGQFIDHDITLVEGNELEQVVLDIPADDEYFPTDAHIFTSRNLSDPGTGTSIDNPRQYINAISSFVDGSAIYGSSEKRANWLRSFNNGKLKVSDGDLLPWNTVTGNPNDEVDLDSSFMADDTRSLNKYFVAGDVRANENPLLTGLHTVFVREHNRLCDKILSEHSTWNDERIYQRARKILGAYIQNILFYEFLPALGVYLPEYQGYSNRMNPGISNVFSAAAFRIGHTLINSDLLRMDNDGEDISSGSIRLKDAFFNPQAILLAGGIDPFFKGMGTQVMQKMDCKVISDLRNFLFGGPGSGGLDLASINIYRGRDRGISDYNTLRQDFGLPTANDFEDFVSTSEDAQTLREIYGSVDNIDAWVGMLAEEHLNNATFGQLVMRIMENQFQSLRDGDRFYFENDPAFTLNERKGIKHTKLYDILMRNTSLSIMQKDLFFAMPHSDIPDGPQIGTELLSASLFPNPALSSTTMKLYADQDVDVTVSIFNNIGQLMSSNEYSVLEGNNSIEIPIEENWPLGFYNILIETGDAYNILRLIKE